MKTSKIGFWPVFALVTGSQIGSGVFMLPASLAPYGTYSLVGWVISGLSAIFLAVVFASLCASFPKTGGAHAYVKEAFGPAAAFFTGWTYWVISWVSTTAVVVASIGYLTPIIGAQYSSSVYVCLEIVLLAGITLLNLKGVHAAGRAEFILTLMKFIPLIIIPVVAIFSFNWDNFVVAESVVDLPTSSILGKVALLTLWGFIGLECATTPAGSVENPRRTIPLAIITGTASVAALYLLNSAGIMGLIPGAQLQTANAPYVDAAQVIFGGSWHLLIAAIAAIACIGTLNAWMLASGQIALGLAEDGLMPKLFKKKDANGAPVWGLLFSAMGIIPLLILTANQSLAEQITAIIDFSVVAFLFIYLICSVALVYLQLKNKVPKTFFKIVAEFCSILFCVWVLSETSLITLLIAGCFVLSGIPMYYFWYHRRAKTS